MRVAIVQLSDSGRLMKINIPVLIRSLMVLSASPVALTHHASGLLRVYRVSDRSAERAGRVLKRWEMSPGVFGRSEQFWSDCPPPPET